MLSYRLLAIDNEAELRGKPGIIGLVKGKARSQRLQAQLSSA
jgi:hypothetical protein